MRVLDYVAAAVLAADADAAVLVATMTPPYVCLLYTSDAADE